MPVRPESLFRQAESFYYELEKRSERNEQDELLYIGFISQLPTVLGLSPSMYNKLRSILIQADSIVFLKRGGRGDPSTVQLLGPPSEEDVNLAARDLTYRPGAARVSDIEQRLERIEGWREATAGVNIMETLRDFEIRISALEVRRETNGEN